MTDKTTDDDLPWWWRDGITPREIFHGRLRGAWAQAPHDLDDSEADLILADLERAGWSLVSGTKP